MGNQKRIYKYDFLRTIAIAMVVAVHCLAFTDNGWAHDDQYYVVMSSLLFTANSLFFIMSGKFNLKEKPGYPLHKLYFKKVRNILLPALLYMFIDIAFTLYIIPGTEGGSILHLLKTYVIGAVDTLSGTVYWFVMLLFGFLLASPFLAHIFSHLSEAETKAFVILGMLWCAFSYVCKNLGLEFGWSYVFTNFFFAFCMGAILTEERVATFSKSTIRLVIASLVSWFFAALLPLAGWTAGAYDTSPLYYLLSFFVYLLLLSIGEKAKPNALVSLIAKHSYGIYLVHLLLMSIFLTYLPRVYGAPSILMHIAGTVLTLFSALLVAIVIDKTLVKWLQAIADVIFNKVTKETVK